MPSITIESPAKINLHLRVAPPHGSGFHPLRSWMVRVSLHDTLCFTTRDVDGITLRTNDPTLPTDDRNLIVRAARVLAPDANLEVELTKRIPAGAGLGGGSGNAATTLLAVNDLLRLGRFRHDLHALAATLGSDVPFFLGSPSAIATGRGENLEPCASPLLARHVVLILPPLAISTAAAYRELDRVRPTADTSATLAAFPAAQWATLPAMQLLPQLVNDLEQAAFAIEPRLGGLRREAEGLLGRAVRMSGSGSTLFTLYNGANAAGQAAAVISARLGVRAIAATVAG